ncbi:hypothetical protein ABW19_dt0206480 [Dactylella cylindrospora]|nr:hypothetical protein ABW19_dt0206480 [Dactylella cylindrospora]
MATVKLPLLARKNIRDEYDAKIGGLKEKIKEYTGEEYNFILDFPTLYPTLDTSQSYQAESPGTIAYNVFEGFTEKLGRITQEGEDKIVVDFFNWVVSSRNVNILVTDESTSYSSCRIKEGVLEILFKPGNYGTNSSYACDELEKELDKAFKASNPGELPLAAKKGFQDDFLAKKEKLEADIAEELLDNKVSLVADPEAIWKTALSEWEKLKKSEKSSIDLDSVARNMGSAIYAYFEGFLGQLQYKFKQDDMMVEAFMESCPSKEIRVALLPKGEISRTYNDAVFDDGALVIRTIPQYWYSNVSYACDEIDKLL